MSAHTVVCPCVSDGQVPCDQCVVPPKDEAACRDEAPEHTNEYEALIADHVVLPSGMVRGDNTGKTDYLLVRDGPMYERWAQLLSREAPRKGRRNWMNADSEADLQRFRESALRHMEQWLRGDEDEDHAAAILFNVNGAEYVRGRLW